MEFAELGDHCDVSSCHQKDFLPFECDRCKGKYCLNHRSYGAHACPDAKTDDREVIQCPLCLESIELISGEDPNVTFERHSLNQCNPEQYKEKQRKKKLKCAVCNEKLSLTNKTMCQTCGSSLCLTHRYPDAHSCADRRRQNHTSIFGRLTGAGSSTPGKSTRAARTNNRGKNIKNFDLKDELRATAHRRRNETPQQTSQGQEQCPHCSRAFQNPMDLINHVESEHFGNSGSGTSAASSTFSCNVCGAVYPRRHQLEQHIKDAHERSSDRCTIS